MEIKKLTVRTGKQQSFVGSLEELCEEHADGGDYDFECYTDEKNEEMLIVENFVIEVKNEKAFSKAVDELCQAFTVPAGQALEFEEEIEGNNRYFEIYEFYIRTAKHETFVKELETLCDKYAIEGDYDFEEYQDDEDEKILMIDSFFIATENPEKMIDDLEVLCKKHAIDDEYGFGFDGQEDEE